MNRSLVLSLLVVGCQSSPVDRAVADAFAEHRFHLVSLLVQKAAAGPPLAFETALLAARAAAADGDLGLAHSLVTIAAETDSADLAALAAAPELAPLRQDGSWAWVERAARAPRRRPEPPEPTDPSRVDAAALEQLLADARAAKSTALVVWRDGVLVGDWTFDGEPRRIESMSATKSVVGLAVGLLVDDGALTLDTKVADVMQEWRRTAHQWVTVRHLLEHVSGLACPRTTEVIYDRGDFWADALGARQLTVPGTQFYYNNRGTNLLAAIVERVSGLPIDVFLMTRLFEPLGIDDVTWSRDRLNHRHGMAGLQIRARDFAKLGQLMLQRGWWYGRRIVSEDWVERSTAASGLYAWHGLLWWRHLSAPEVSFDERLFSELGRAALPPGVERKLRPLAGRVLTSVQLDDELARRLTPQERRAVDLFGKRLFAGPNPHHAQLTGFAAEGAYGQYLYVVPEAKLVAVRMTASYDDGEAAVAFPEFFRDVEGLAGLRGGR